MDSSEISKIHQRHSDCQIVRARYDDLYDEISDFIDPEGVQRDSSDTNDGSKKWGRVLDDTATDAWETLRAGLMSGMSSPARPWFRLSTGTPDLDESYAVKSWLSDVTRVVQMVFSKSNLYRALHQAYGDIGAYGTSAMILEPSFRSIVHANPLVTGSYCLAADYHGQINTLYRTMYCTTVQMVQEFGLKNCSLAVQNAWTANNYSSLWEVLHVIEPRPEEQRDRSKHTGLHMAYRSAYLQPGEIDRVLREGGFREFRAVAPRWDVRGMNVYGSSPAMRALGMVKGLQADHQLKNKALAYQADPPLVLDSSLKNQAANLLPGGLTYADLASGKPGIQSAFDVRLDLNGLSMDVQDLRNLIRQAFYADVFMKISMMDKTMTATEAGLLQDEKMTKLGPVIERLTYELFYPLIDNIFARCVEAGVLPEAPAELQGQELQVEFVSILAQAQRSVATNGIDRFVGALGTVATAKPEVMDKFDADKWADLYADLNGVDPDLIVPGEQVAIIRQSRAQQQQAAQAAQNAQMNAAAANQLAQASAKNGEMQQYTGYN